MRRSGTSREEAVLRRRLSTAQGRVLDLQEAVTQAAEDLRLGKDASAVAGRLEELAEEPPHYENDPRVTGR